MRSHDRLPAARKHPRRNRSACLIVVLLGCVCGSTQARQTILQNGLEGYSGTQDVTLRGDYPELKAANLWGDATLYVSGVPWGGSQAITLIRFDGLVGTGKSQIPHGATITSARLEFFKLKDFPRDDGQYAKAAPADTISVYRMQTHFKAGDTHDTKNTHCASFSYRDNDPELAQFWGEKNQLENGPVAGADYVAEPIAATRLQPSTENQWTGWDVTGAVADWAKGTVPNEGLYLMTHSFWIGASFASSDNADKTHRPRLVVEWAAP